MKVIQGFVEFVDDLVHIVFLIQLFLLKIAQGCPEVIDGLVVHVHVFSHLRDGALVPGFDPFHSSVLVNNDSDHESKDEDNNEDRSNERNFPGFDLNSHVRVHDVLLSVDDLPHVLVAGVVAGSGQSWRVGQPVKPVFADYSGHASSLSFRLVHFFKW